MRFIHTVTIEVNDVHGRRFFVAQSIGQRLQSGRIQKLDRHPITQRFDRVEQRLGARTWIEEADIVGAADDHQDAHRQREWFCQRGLAALHTPSNTNGRLFGKDMALLIGQQFPR